MKVINNETKKKQKRNVNSFHAFSRPLITFANSLHPDQDRQNVYLDPTIWHSDTVHEKVNFERH